MTPRAIRRAAARKAQKQARKAAAIQNASQTPVETVVVSEPRLAANRANAQLSTGPTTPEGKAKSCLNALKSGLTGATVVLPGEDLARYEQHLLAYQNEFHPVTERECVLVQSIADSDWRMLRIPVMEMTIFAHGRAESLDEAAVEQHPEATRANLIDFQTFLRYEKQIRNLQLQEARLHRRREKDLQELRRAQEERRQREQAELEQAAKLYLAAQQDNQPFDPAAHGFVFSIDLIEGYLARVRASQERAAAMRQAMRTASQAA